MMNRWIVFGFFLGSWGTLSTTFAAGALYSAKHCAEVRMKCRPKARLLKDATGRCGCLYPKDYTPQKTCVVAKFGCDPKNGVTFSSLMFRGETVGCGCFKTIH